MLYNLNKINFKFLISTITLCIISFCFISCLNKEQRFTENLISNYGENIFIDQIIFESDVPFEKDEFFYLTGLKEKSVISETSIKNAYKNLLNKEKFSKVEINIEKNKKNRILKFKLESCWMFEKLKLKGILFDKHKYSCLYKNQPGKKFSIENHTESLKNIKNLLHENGHFNCSVNDELFYKKKKKNISAEIKIKKGKRFKIKKIDFNFSKDKNQTKKNKLKNYQRTLEKKIAKKIIQSYYSKKLITKQVKKLRNFFRKRGFVNCRISIKNKIDRTNKSLGITFQISLGICQILKFEGNQFFSEKQIRENLLGLDYPAWFFTPEIIAQQLLHEYYKKGFWNCIIHYKKRAIGSFLFEIDEKKQMLVKDVLVKKPIRYGNLEQIKGKPFDEQLLEKTLDNIENSYKENGYWDFEIVKRKIVKNKKTNSCQIMLTIKEGKQRIWEGLSLSGYKREFLNQFFSKYPNNNQENIPFNFFWIQEQKLFLLNKLQQEGYWYASVNPEFKSSIINLNSKKKLKKTLIHWKISPGKKTKFGKVIIKGNTKLPFRRILREISFSQGKDWKEESLEKTRKRLKKLDIFSLVQLQSQNLFNNQEEIPVELTLIDDEPLQARFRLGYFLTSKNFLFKRESTFKFGMSLISKNPTNHADKLLINADFTRFESKFDIDYTIPSPFGLKDLIGNCRAYTNKYIHPVQIRNSKSAYEGIDGGICLGLNNEFKKDYFWKLDVGNEWIKTNKVRGDLKLDPGYINHTIPFIFFQPSFVVEKLDNKLSSKKGSVSFASLKFMVPHKTGKPISKVMFEQSAFKPISKKITLATRARFGYIFRSKFEQIQPSQRFYLGGPYSVRGYEKDAIPPVGEIDCINSKGRIEKRYNIQGGSGMINCNLELRFDIYKNFGGVLFQDIGVLTQSGFSGFKGKWFPSTGFGLRYKTPIGPIRFDIGWKWKHILPKDSSFAWYLTLGEAF